MIKKVWPDGPDDDLKTVESIIQQFNGLDKSGQSFRYARDKHGAPHLQSAPGHVNLGSLKATVDAVSSFLDAAYAGIEFCDPGSS